MSTRSKQGKSKPRKESVRIAAGQSPRAAKPDLGATKGRRILSEEAEETLNAIRAGQVDALVIQGDDSDKLYAIRSFVDIQRTQAALRNAGTARRRSDAQLKALAEERERLFQDMHDGCIHSIYAVGLNLEACLRVIDDDTKQARRMIADATVSLNLVIQELRSFITGHRLQIAPGHNLRTEIQRAVEAARTHGLKFAVDIDESTMQRLTAEQALHLLQIAREGISNATRHANARTGRISLQERAGTIYMELSDDGTGFVGVSVNKLGLGLHHIKARARQIGGKAVVTSAPNQGTKIVITLRER
jgi:signal transduction histidine kinase